MSSTEWFLFGVFGVLYIALIATLAVQTYQKGHLWLFVLGFLVPVLWMIGALLRPKPHSAYEQRERAYWRERDRELGSPS